MSCCCNSTVEFNQLPSDVGNNTPFDFAIVACGLYMQNNGTFSGIPNFFSTANTNLGTTTIQLGESVETVANSVYVLDITTLQALPGFPVGCTDVQVKIYEQTSGNQSNITVACGCVSAAVAGEIPEAVKVSMVAACTTATTNVPIFVHDGSGSGVGGLAGNLTLFDGGAGPALVALAGGQAGWYQVPLSEVQLSAGTHVLDYNNAGNVSSSTVICVTENRANVCSVETDAITALSIQDGAIDTATFTIGAITAAVIDVTACGEIADCVWNSNQILDSTVSPWVPNSFAQCVCAASNPWATQIGAACAAETGLLATDTFGDLVCDLHSVLDAADVTATNSFVNLIASEVWEEATAAHTTVGTFGECVCAAANPWTTQIGAACAAETGLLATDTFGDLVCDLHAALDAADLTVTNSFVSLIASEVWEEATAAHTTVGTFGACVCDPLLIRDALELVATTGEIGISSQLTNIQTCCDANQTDITAIITTGGAGPWTTGGGGGTGLPYIIEGTD